MKNNLNDFRFKNIETFVGITSTKITFLAFDGR